MKFAELAPELVKKVVLTCSVSHNGIFFYTNEVACTTMELIKENPKIKFMESIISTSNRAAVTQVFQSLLLTHTKEFTVDKCQDMITGALKQRCYVDVMFALANTDININAVKAKVWNGIFRD